MEISHCSLPHMFAQYWYYLEMFRQWWLLHSWHTLQVMESASETYEQRKKSLEAQNAQMLSEIHEFEFIRSRLKKIVQEESALLDEQGCEDDEDEESQTVAEGIEADRDEKHAPEPA